MAGKGARLGLAVNSISGWQHRVPRKTHLDVSAAHVMLVTLQRQVPVLRVDETNQSLAVSSALRVETQRNTAPGRAQVKRCETWTLVNTSRTEEFSEQWRELSVFYSR